MSKRTQYSPSEIALAVRLYADGLSIRAVEKACAVGASTVRKAAREGGVIRGRLDFQGTDEQRLRNYTIAPNGCWIWAGHVNNMGYGVTTIGGRKALAHRAMCALHGKPVPKGMDACHSCDDPRCCNPAHIFPGSRADNMRDAANKGRTLRGERVQSATLTEETVRRIRHLYERGMRQCQIARETGVDHRRVHEIVHRRAWVHVA